MESSREGSCFRPQHWPVTYCRGTTWTLSHFTADTTVISENDVFNISISPGFIRVPSWKAATARNIAPVSKPISGFTPTMGRTLNCIKLLCVCGSVIWNSYDSTAFNVEWKWVGGERTGIKVPNHVLLLLFSKYKNTCRAKALPDVDSIYLQSKRPLNGSRMCLFVLLYLRLSFFLLFFAPLPPSFSVLQPKSYLRSCSDLGKMLKPSQQVSLPLRKAAQQDPCLRAQPRLTLLQFYNKRQQLRRERLAHGHGLRGRKARAELMEPRLSILPLGRTRPLLSGWCNCFTAVLAWVHPGPLSSYGSYFPLIVSARSRILRSSEPGSRFQWGGSAQREGARCPGWFSPTCASEGWGESDRRHLGSFAPGREALFAPKLKVKFDGLGTGRDAKLLRKQSPHFSRRWGQCRIKCRWRDSWS